MQNYLNFLNGLLQIGQPHLNIKKSNYVIFRFHQRIISYQPKLGFRYLTMTKQSQVLLECKEYVKYLNHGQKYTGPTPPFTPQTILDVCIQNFFLVSTLYRGRGGRTGRKFRIGCTFLWGNREMTGTYKYCITVPRTFVHDCSYSDKQKPKLERTHWSCCVEN